MTEAAARARRLRILDEHGAPIAGRDLEIVPGPGAKKRTIARYQNPTFASGDRGTRASTSR